MQHARSTKCGEAIAMTGTYFAAGLGQTLAKDCTAHLCTQERKRPTDGCPKDDKLDRAEASNGLKIEKSGG